MTVRLPTRYVNVPVELVYSDLPAVVQRTATRIYGLGWQHRYERTDPVRLDELMSVCGLERRQLFAHLRVLVNRGVLRYSYSRRVGIYVFELLLGKKSADFRTHLSLGVVVDSSVLSDVSISASKQQQQLVGTDGGECEGGEVECGFVHSDPWEELDEWREVLGQMGILEPVRGELASKVSLAELEAWRDWWEVHPEVGVGLLVVQLREGVQAPELTQEERAKLDMRRRFEEVVVR